MLLGRKQWREGGTLCLAGAPAPPRGGPAAPASPASLHRCCQAGVHTAPFPFRKQERKQRRRKKKNRVIHQGFLQPEGGEGVPSLPDPVAGAPLLAKEIALVGFYYFSSLDFTSFYYLF